MNDKLQLSFGSEPYKLQLFFEIDQDTDRWSAKRRVPSIIKIGGSSLPCKVRRSAISLLQ